MMQDGDEYDVFGCFVASESRSLKQDSNRRRLKRIIQRAILDVAEDDETRPTDTPNNDRSYVCRGLPKSSRVLSVVQKVATAVHNVCLRMIFPIKIRKSLGKC